MSRPNKRQREQARRERRAERRAQGTSGPSTTDSTRPSNTEPVRGATAPFIDEAKRWHLARTVPLLGPLGRQHLDESLRKLAVPAYRPRVSEVVVRRGRRVVKRVPLLIRTLIIGVDDEEHLSQVVALPGVSEIVSHPEPEGNADGNVAGTAMRPALLDPVALQAFMVAVASGEVVRPTGIGIGDRVIVRDGPFASFPGVVEEVLANDRIKVAVSIFGRASPVTLDIAQVERV